MPRCSPAPPTERLSWPGATGLAEDVRRYGKWMRDEAEKRIGHLYPKVNDLWRRLHGHRLDLGAHGDLPKPGLRRNDAARQSRSGLARRRARSATSSRSRTGSESGSRSAARMVFPAKERSVAPARCACSAERQFRCPTSATRARPAAWVRNSWRSLQKGKRQRYYVAPTEEHEKAADVPRPDDVPEAETSTQSSVSHGPELWHAQHGPISSPIAN